MTIRLRILALLTLLSLFCVGTTQYFNRLHQNEDVLSRQQRMKNVSARLQRLVGSLSRSTNRYLHDYSGRSGMAGFLANGEPAWAEKNIKSMMEPYHFDLVWVLKADGTVVYGLDRSADSGPTAPPLPPDGLRRLLERNVPFDFYASLGGKLHQVQGRPILAGEDLNRQTAPLGWLVVAKHWDDLLLQDLDDPAQGRILLTPATHASDARPEELEAWLPLLDDRGHAIAGVDYHVLDPLEEDPAMEQLEFLLFVLNGAGAVLLVGVLMHFWIMRPFSLVRNSLAARDPALLVPLLNQRNEFGQMARLVQSSMHDRDQLQEVLEERMRLGRELHDGVIQSVYGTGMALSRAQSLMGRDQPAAEKLLDETKVELNRIILDLRRHIEKADPKPLETSFGAAVAQLIRQFHGPEPVAMELEIDEDLVARYASLLRIQALQFVREAVSNAMRHGLPTRIVVSWQGTPEGSTLLVGDNGVGFDPTAVTKGGRGLGNLGERAVSLGGRLEIESRPNHGTRVCLMLPTPKAPA